MPLLVGTFHDLWDAAALMAFHNSKTRNCTSAKTVKYFQCNGIQLMTTITSYEIVTMKIYLLVISMILHLHLLQTTAGVIIVLARRHLDSSFCWPFNLLIINTMTLMIIVILVIIH